MKTMHFPLYSIIILLFVSCNNQVEENVLAESPPPQYENNIGDTPFDPSLDDPDFKFCDSTDVLHKRAFVRYEGGKRAMEKELSDKYVAQSSYKNYSGYFIIRFVINCQDQTDRFRVQTLDTNFNLSKCPPELEKHILSIAKNLKGWTHPFYNQKDYDGYRFINIKMINGQIVSV